MKRTSQLLGKRRRALLAIGAVVALTYAVIRLQNGQAAPEDTATFTASRGNLTVTVGGVGRIVAGAASEIVLPVTASGTGTRSSGATSAPGDSVFPRAVGRVSRFLVTPGQRVKAGQALALLDDAGLSTTAIRQARLDLSTALLELRQKRTKDPLRGLPPTPAELAAARAAVTSAHARLTRVQGPPHRSEIAAIRLDIRRAEAELEALRGGGALARAAGIQIAEQNVRLARIRLDRLYQPASAADISQAQAELKRAESELSALRRPQIVPSPEALAAAQLAIANARGDLARAQQSGDLEQLREAQASLDSALADLALLLRPGPTALPEQIAAAEAAVDAAKKKLERLLGPPNASDVAAARLELERAEVELRLKKATPAGASLAAAHQAIVSAQARLEQLLGPPLATDLTAVQLDVRRAEADLAVLEARGGPASVTEIELAQLKVLAGRARLDSARFAKRLLVVRAPWPGTVTSLLTVPGSPVDVATPVIAVSDLSRLSATVDLSEFDAALVRQGLPATVRVDALGGKSFPARVRYASPTGTNAGGVVIFPVYVALTRTSGLKPGMNVSVRIVVAQRRNVLQVPLDAVTEDSEGRTIVTLVGQDGETTSRTVKLGLANNQYVQILAGLAPGDRVLLEPLAADEGGGDEEAAGA